MKTTLGWLKTHIDLTASLDQMVSALAMRGLEVDGIEDRAKDLKPFIVARVMSAEKHPNADKLKLCRVDIGGQEVQVVCGAPNAHAPMLAVFAPVGSVIPRTGAVLKASAIRGVESQGMLCSGYELGLSDDHTGIIELPAGLTAGASFAAAMGFDDPVLDIKITANRADCLGVRRPGARSRRVGSRHAEAAKHRAGTGQIPVADRGASRRPRRQGVSRCSSAGWCAA